MPFTSIDGFRMFYDVRGEGDVVVFIHGGFPSLDMHLRAASSGEWGWETDFTSEFRFVMSDRRGCWLSARPESGYDLENQARDLAELLDHLDIESVHVIGSSAGGPIAILFAACNPERVKTLVLAGTAAHLWPDDDPITRIVKRQLEILYKQGAASAWKCRPEGVELSLDVLWERDEMEERGTLAEYEERVKKLVAKSSFLERIEWYGTQLKSIDAYLDRDLSVECGRISGAHACGSRSQGPGSARGLGQGTGSEDSRRRIPAYIRKKPHSVVHRSARVRADLMAFFRKAGEGAESPRDADDRTVS